MDQNAFDALLEDLSQQMAATQDAIAGKLRGNMFTIEQANLLSARLGQNSFLNTAGSANIAVSTLAH